MERVNVLYFVVSSLLNVQARPVTTFPILSIMSVVFPSDQNANFSAKIKNRIYVFVRTRTPDLPKMISICKHLAVEQLMLMMLTSLH